jgi:hypothetical protein
MTDADLRFYSIEEAAQLCRRHRRTLENLLSRYPEIRRRKLWKVYRRKRRRLIFLDGVAVRQLQALTLGARGADALPPFNRLSEHETHV